MMTRGASSPECAENWELRISDRNSLGRVSEATGVSGASAKLIWWYHVSGHISRKPGVRTTNGTSSPESTERRRQLNPRRNLLDDLRDTHQVEYRNDLLSFGRSDILWKLKDGSKQTRRPPQLELRYEASQILGEVVWIKSEGSSGQARTVSRRSEDLSPWPMFGQRLEAGRWNSFHQLAMTSRQAVGAEASATLKKWKRRQQTPSDDDVTVEDDHRGSEAWPA